MLRQGGRGLRYSRICVLFKNAGIENYAREAAILVEELFGSVSGEIDYDSPELEAAVEKRCSGYPLQYILGKWWFGRCELEVSEDCLVPRPDTECVVEEAVRLLPQNSRFADLCTGSGCIAISLLDLRRDLSGVAVELYPKTLEIAKKNAAKNGVRERLTFKEGDVLAGDVLESDIFSAIISNPPYIRTEVVDSLVGEVTFEPRAALDGGEDGLVFYRAIIRNYADNLEADGCFIFEIGYDQASDIAALAFEGGYSCRIVKDLGGNDRAAILYKQKQNF